MALTQKEITERLTELRNLRKLYSAQKLRIKSLEAEVQLLKQENQELRAQNVLLTGTVSEIKLQMEELRTMVFGKKQKVHDHDDDTPVQKTPRTKDSYHRPLPKEQEVTETKNHAVDACTHCHGTFAERDTVTYFEEDIPLPQQKAVTKHTVEKGYCARCRKWSTGAPLPSARVILGETVKRYVVYLSVVCRLSYTQIQDILQQTYEFALSPGEIAKILSKEGVSLYPAYEQLKASIRGEPSVHLDETIWNITCGDGYKRYAWTMVGGISTDVVFLLGKTRGKGNATDLLGDSTAVVVSDDYGAYRTLRNPHQLCCAHILRKLRDLAESGQLTPEVHDHCVELYQSYAGIYTDIEKARQVPLSAVAYTRLLERLHTFANTHPFDFKKLTSIKQQIAKRAENYLTCLRHRAVVADNNAAERSLRHLVLKRKISFGSFSEKTADTLAVLLSVLLSYKRRGTLRDYLLGV